MYNATENLFDALPFKNLVNYDIELLFENSKTRIKKLMTDHRLVEYIKEQKLSNIFEATKMLQNCPEWPVRVLE